MKEILERCAGLDVHQKTIVVCIMIGFGKKMKQIIRTFGTTTEELRSLAEWLKAHEVKEIGIESTGVYWIPVYNILQDEANLNLTLANAQHIKNVPGRKTDVKDSAWLCQLLKNGLIAASFIPVPEIRRMRSVLRYRKKLTQQLGSAKNRIIKSLETSNIKIASVFSDVFGPSGLRVIKAIASGETNPIKLMKHVGKQIKASRVDIQKALTGTLKSEDLFELNLKIEHVEMLKALITKADNHIQTMLEPYKTEAKLLEDIPGVSTTVAATIISEIGINMDQFHSASHLASWAGLAPGNYESAGRKKSSVINVGNQNLKTVLVEAAWSAVKSKKSYFSTVYQRIKIRRGPKRALIAVTRKMLIIAYWILKNHIPYIDLGANYVDPRAKERRIDYLTKKLAELGCSIQISKFEPISA